MREFRYLMFAIMVSVAVLLFVIFARCAFASNLVDESDALLRAQNDSIQVSVDAYYELHKTYMSLADSYKSLYSFYEEAIKVNKECRKDNAYLLKNNKALVVLNNDLVELAKKKVYVERIIGRGNKAWMRR